MGLDQANFDDITKNSKHLVFKHSYDPKLLTEMCQNGGGNVVAINSNYAIQSGINLKQKSIAYEKTTHNSLYNIIAIRKGKRHYPKIKTLLRILHSKAIQRWIKKTIQKRGCVS